MQKGQLKFTEDCGEIRRHPVLGLHKGVVLMKDLLPVTLDVDDPLVEFKLLKLLLRDTGKLHLRTGGAGGRRLPFAANIFRTGVFGKEMEVRSWIWCLVCCRFGCPSAVEDVDESNKSCELSLDEEQLKLNIKGLIIIIYASRL